MTDDFRAGMLRAAEIARGENRNHANTLTLGAAIADAIELEAGRSSATPSPTGKPARDGEGPCPLCGEPGEGYSCDCARGTTGKPASPGGEVGAVCGRCDGTGREYVGTTAIGDEVRLRCDACGGTGAAGKR